MTVFGGALARTLLIMSLFGCATTQPLPKQGEYQQLHSLLVYKDGVLVTEQYYSGNDDFIEFSPEKGEGIKRNRSRPDKHWQRDDLHYVASVNKAFTSTLTGIALSQLGLSVEHAVIDLLPAYLADLKRPELQGLKIKHLLTMQMGFDWDEWNRDDLAQLWQSEDFARFLLSRENIGPGSRWRYNSAGPNLLLTLLDTQLQQQFKQSLRDWAEQHLFAPLEITHYRWFNQPSCIPEGSARLHLRPIDMLKLGIVYLNNGQWQGQQLVPKAWVNVVKTAQVKGPAGDYSYLFWQRTVDGQHYISADGDGGQYVNIFPQHNMVIVITQGNYLQWPLYAKQADRIMVRVLEGLR